MYLKITHNHMKVWKISWYFLRQLYYVYILYTILWIVMDCIGYEVLSPFYFSVKDHLICFLSLSSSLSTAKDLFNN